MTVKSDGNGGVIISKKALLPIGFVIFLISFSIGITTYTVTMRADLDYTMSLRQSDNEKIGKLLSDIQEIKVSVAKIETILGMGRGEIELADLNPGDLVHVKLPYEDSPTKEYWIELAAEDPIAWR